MFTSVSYTTNAAVQPKLPFDPLADIAGVAMVGTAPTLLVVHPALPAKSVKELIALARARPGQLNYASNGVGHPSAPADRNADARREHLDGARAL